MDFCGDLTTEFKASRSRLIEVSQKVKRSERETVLRQKADRTISKADTPLPQHPRINKGEKRKSGGGVKETREKFFQREERFVKAVNSLVETDPSVNIQAEIFLAVFAMRFIFKGWSILKSIAFNASVYQTLESFCKEFDVLMFNLQTDECCEWQEIKDAWEIGVFCIQVFGPDPKPTSYSVTTVVSEPLIEELRPRMLDWCARYDAETSELGRQEDFERHRCAYEFWGY